MDPLLAIALLGLAAFAAGAQNAVAGGGTFLTFPTLLFLGTPAIQANATSTVGVWPGSLSGLFGFREDLRHERRTLLLFGALGLLGGIAGALLLIYTPERTFRNLVPFLLAGATIVFAAGPALTRWLRARALHAPLWLLALAQLAVAVYGGYFGAGIGILMLALLSLFGMTDIHAMNGLKNALALLINASAIALFVLAGLVVWPLALTMAAASLLGGYAGARVSKKVEPRYLRWFIIAVGAGLSVWFFVRA